ncbi:MAG: 1-deoxy-D-xylulose-5-phosphate reductoisomerase [Oscillospiraceae bacterium]|nr:1-deoxy-D-xylulose-5-phosphate reductoisomerase [Oscillospiraceae bacterium]
MTRCISVLGSTGSIGTQTLDVARKYNIKISALTAHSNVKLIEEQIREFKPSLAVMFDEKAASDLKTRIADLDVRILSGMDGLIEAAAEESCDTVLNSLVGMVGLEPTLAAAEARKNIALANKETLVAGGELVMNKVKEYGVKLLPVDSEHSAIFQCLEGCPDRKYLKKLILTASGGPFFGKTRGELEKVTLSEALRHPNWSMGAKITIDSATMMNKGLEIIEARWLFDVPGESIDVVVHRQSIIHSLVEFTDNSVLAQLGNPDMRIPIQYALTYPERYPSLVKPLNLSEIATVTFDSPDYEAFECLKACKKALSLGGTAPAVANAANEVANALFREGKISFLKIGELVSRSIEEVESTLLNTLEDVLNADKAARDFVLSCI